MKFNSIASVVADIQKGKMVIVVDDEDRENEGDLTIAADNARAMPRPMPLAPPVTNAVLPRRSANGVWMLETGLLDTTTPSGMICAAAAPYGQKTCCSTSLPNPEIQSGRRPAG